MRLRHLANQLKTIAYVLDSFRTNGVSSLSAPVVLADLTKLAQLLFSVDLLLADRGPADIRHRLTRCRDAVTVYVAEVTTAAMLGDVEQASKPTRHRLAAALGQIEDCTRTLLKLLRPKRSKQRSGSESPVTLSPPQVAKALRVSPDTVLSWIRTKQLPAANVATGPRPRWVVQRPDLDTFLQSRRPQSQPARKRSKPVGGFRKYRD